MVCSKTVVLLRPPLPSMPWTPKPNTPPTPQHPSLFPFRGVYLVAADADDAEGWVDAILLLAHLMRLGRLGGVKAALAVR